MYAYCTILGAYTSYYARVHYYNVWCGLRGCIRLVVYNLCKSFVPCGGAWSGLKVFLFFFPFHLLFPVSLVDTSFNQVLFFPPTPESLYSSTVVSKKQIQTRSATYVNQCLMGCVRKQTSDKLGARLMCSSRRARWFCSQHCSRTVTITIAEAYYGHLLCARRSMKSEKKKPRPARVNYCHFHYARSGDHWLKSRHPTPHQHPSAHTHPLCTHPYCIHMCVWRKSNSPNPFCTTMKDSELKNVHTHIRCVNVKHRKTRRSIAAQHKLIIRAID